MYGELLPMGGGDPIPLLKKNLLVGRRESCDIVLRFSNVSAHHCQLTVTAGYWYVRDIKSRNGVKVNGIRVTEKRLDPGDVHACNSRAIARCHLGQVDASLDDWMQVVRLGGGAPAAEELQRFMRDVGFYKGAINGDFDTASQKALREWTVAGCPTSDE